MYFNNQTRQEFPAVYYRKSQPEYSGENITGMKINFSKLNKRGIKSYTKSLLPDNSLIRTTPIHFCIYFLLIFQIYALAGSYEEYQIKAAFLHKFAKFIDWPPSEFSSDSDPFVLCILGKDPFGKAIDSLQDKTAGNRKLIIKRAQSADSIGRCHVLFISSSEKTDLQQILKAVRNRHILTVGDTEGFANSGVMINFILNEGKVQFEINSRAAKQGGLILSSQLLKVSKIIGENK